MGIPADVIPPEAEALADDLQRRGYSVAEERYDEASFGNTLIVLERDTTRVRLVRDRGQWFVEVAGGHDWFSPVIWRAFLESSMPPVEIVPLAVQARWLLDDLGRIQAIGDLTEDQLADLNDRRSRRAAARRELPPSG